MKSDDGTLCCPERHGSTEHPFGDSCVLETVTSVGNDTVLQLLILCHKQCVVSQSVSFHPVRTGLVHKQANTQKLLASCSSGYILPSLTR